MPPRIFLGAAQENPVLLTRQDWRGPRASWGPKGIGYWEVKVVTRARYDVKLRFDPSKTDGEARLALCGVTAQQPIKAGAEECVFKDLQVPAGPGRLEATVQEGRPFSA